MFYILIALVAITGYAKMPLDLTTTEGQLKAIGGAAARHPGMVTVNFSYGRSFLMLVKDVPEVVAALKKAGANVHPLEADDTRFLSTVVFGVEATYDPASVSQLREDLLRLRNDLPNIPFKNIKSDLARLREISGDADQTEKHFRAYFSLLPLIYDSQGKAIRSKKNP